jgi:hypothetical protein
MLTKRNSLKLPPEVAARDRQIARQVFFENVRETISAFAWAAGMTVAAAGAFALLVAFILVVGS